MSGGGGDVEWGNGQPGNQSYDPNYGTAKQAPTTELQGTPGEFNTGDPTQTGGNAALNTQFQSASGGGTGSGGGGPVNPTTSGGGFSTGPSPSLVTSPGFDNSNYSPGTNFGNVLSFNASDSGFGGGGGDTGSGGGSQPITNLASAASSGAGGFESVGGAGNLNSFAPGGGINIPSDYPDLTSNASTTGTADGTPNTGGAVSPFATPNTVVGSGFSAANDATRSGDFDQSPTNYTNPDAATPLQSGFSPSNLGGAAPGGSASSIGGSPSIADVASSAQPSATTSTGQPTDPYATPQSTQPASAPAAVAAAPATKPTDDRSALDKLADGAQSALTKNPLGILAAGAGLGLNLARGNQAPAGLADMTAAAASLKNTGSVLQSYMQTGTLPPGMQASVDQATAAAKARIIQNYASRGLNTNPTQNSALQQELQQLQQNAIITAAQIGDKLMTEGLSATQISAQIYNNLITIDRQRQAATGSAIASFAAALSGGGGGTTIKLGGSTNA